MRIEREARAIFGEEAVYDRGLQRAGRFLQTVLVTVLLAEQLMGGTDGTTNR